MEVKFTPDRITKNTVRFAEVGDTQVVGSMYLQKSVIKKFGVETPDEVKELTIEIKTVK